MESSNSSSRPVNLTAQFEEVVEEDPSFDRKFEIATAGAMDHIKQHLLTRITRANCRVIIE